MVVWRHTVRGGLSRFRKDSGMFALRSAALTVAALGLGFLATGCTSSMYDENQALHKQNNELQAELDQARARLSDTEGRLSKAPDEATVAQQQARIKELEDQLRQAQTAAPAPGAPATAAPAARPDPALAGIEATYDKARGTLTVNLPGEILFQSGQAVLKDSAKPTLDKIAAAIKKDYANKTIFIDGHTDADPIVRTKAQWEDNWDLAGARANAVRRYLTDHGVNSKTVNLRAFGPNHPKKDKASSRRVEIVVQVR